MASSSCSCHSSTTSRPPSVVWLGVQGPGRAGRGGEAGRTRHKHRLLSCQPRLLPLPDCISPESFGGESWLHFNRTFRRRQGARRNRGVCPRVGSVGACVCGRAHACTMASPTQHNTKARTHCHILLGEAALVHQPRDVHFALPHAVGHHPAARGGPSKGQRKQHRQSGCRCLHALPSTCLPVPAGFACACVPPDSSTPSTLPPLACWPRCLKTPAPCARAGPSRWHQAARPLGRRGARQRLEQEKSGGRAFRWAATLLRMGRAAAQTAEAPAQAPAPAPMPTPPASAHAAALLCVASACSSCASVGQGPWCAAGGRKSGTSSETVYMGGRGRARALWRERGRQGAATTGQR